MASKYDSTNIKTFDNEVLVQKFKRVRRNGEKYEMEFELFFILDF